MAGSARDIGDMIGRIIWSIYGGASTFVVGSASTSWHPGQRLTQGCSPRQLRIRRVGWELELSAAYHIDHTSTRGMQLPCHAEQVRCFLAVLQVLDIRERRLASKQR